MSKTIEEKANAKGYIIKRDYDGDSDNFERWMILTHNGDIVRRGIYTYCLEDIVNKLSDITRKSTKKLVIIMDSKEGDTNHICNQKSCPFYSKTEEGDMGILCKKLWATPPKGKSSLASLCNYYDIQNLIIAEVEGCETINQILNNNEQD